MGAVVVFGLFVYMFQMSVCVCVVFVLQMLLCGGCRITEVGRIVNE